MSGPVLLIEDNEQNRYLAKFLLEKSGHKVVSASDGPAGIALGNALAPSIILVDIQLPKMNGYDVVRALRGNAALQNVPIIAVTAYAMAGDREKAIEAGCNGYIEKPIDPDNFVAEIEQFLCRENS